MQPRTALITVLAAMLVGAFASAATAQRTERGLDTSESLRRLNVKPDSEPPAPQSAPARRRAPAAVDKQVDKNIMLIAPAERAPAASRRPARAPAATTRMPSD